MSDIPSKYDYVKQYIPDPQVEDVADQFFDAAELLWTQPPGSGTVVPAIVNSVLSIELYLKSLTAYSVIKQDYGKAMRGGVVTVEREKSGRSGHELTALFDVADTWIKEAFEKQYHESIIFKPSSTFRDCLSSYDEVFIKVRYLYENSTYFKKLSIDELRMLMKLVRATVESLPRQTRVIK